MGNIDSKTTPTDPLVSVIIPTYNRGWILSEAIDSVLSQTFTDFELIVVDDGSSDDTNRLLDVYRDRLRIITQTNAGVSAARNRGVSSATGRFIAFLDSDDLWLPEKLAVQTAFMQATPDIQICQTEEIWVRNGLRVNPKQKHRKPSGMIFEPSLNLCLVSPSAVMMKKALFEQAGGFDETLLACEDYDLWLRISRQIPIHLIDTALIVKRGGHPDQLSRGWGLDRYRIRALEKLLHTQALSPDHYRAVVTVLKQKATIYANGCLKRNRTGEAEAYIRLAQRYKTVSFMRKS